MRVLKFGGASLASARSFENLKVWMTQAGDKPRVLVTSAMFGVTDNLLQLITLAENSNEGDLLSGIEGLRKKHLELAVDLGLGGFASAVNQELVQLSSMLTSCCNLAEVSARARDRILSFGERLSALVAAAYLCSLGLPAQRVCGEEVIVTDGRFGNAMPLFVETERECQSVLGKLLAEGVTPVVCGFTGRTPGGRTTTLGRGGSDLTASIVARSLKAEQVWYLKETDGIMSADPRLVSSARMLRRLSYSEMTELSFFGAKVLHPIAMQPLKDGSIEARILNFSDAMNPGTTVGKDSDPSPAVKSITAVSSIALITVEGLGMAGTPGLAGRLFSAMARERVNVLMISQASSEQNICFVVHRDEAPQAARSLREEFAREMFSQEIDHIRVREDVCVLALVGQGMAGTPGIAGRIFSLLGGSGINVILIAQGSSEYNISFVIERDCMHEAINVLHAGLCENSR